MTGDERAAKLLADVVAGNHIGMIERVQINAAKGGNITITPLDGSAAAPQPEGSSGMAKAIDDGPKTTVAPLDPRDIRKVVEASYADAINAAVADAQTSESVETTETPSEPVEATPAPAVTEPEPVSDPAAAPAVKPKREKAPAPQTDRQAAKAEREAQAFKMADEGKSLREIERVVHIDRKRLGKLLKERAASKAAE